MREILFKAKRMDNGEWIEGFYLKYIKPRNGEIEHRIFVSDSDGITWYAVYENTICQYTGLTDKNGNKIWENDILRGHGNPKDLAKVAFGKFHVIEVESLENIDSVIGWHTEVIPTDALSKCEPFCLPMPLTDFYIDFSEFEVIGNIFDNSELLKAGEA